MEQEPIFLDSVQEIDIQRLEGQLEFTFEQPVSLIQVAITSLAKLLGKKE